MARPGRPEIPIDEVQLEKLAMLQCTQEEMAAWFGCTPETIRTRLKRNGYFGAVEKGRGRGKVSLRRLQWKQAERGNAAMLIWLGKQHLGQVDKAELTGKDGGPQVFEVVLNTAKDDE